MLDRIFEMALNFDANVCKIIFYKNSITYNI